MFTILCFFIDKTNMETLPNSNNGPDVLDQFTQTAINKFGTMLQKLNTRKESKQENNEKLSTSHSDNEISFFENALNQKTLPSDSEIVSMTQSIVLHQSTDNLPSSLCTSDDEKEIFDSVTPSESLEESIHSDETEHEDKNKNTNRKEKRSIDINDIRAFADKALLNEMLPKSLQNQYSNEYERFQIDASYSFFMCLAVILNEHITCPILLKMKLCEKMFMDSFGISLANALSIGNGQRDQVSFDYNTKKCGDCLWFRMWKDTSRSTDKEKLFSYLFQHASNNSFSDFALMAQAISTHYKKRVFIYYVETSPQNQYPSIVERHFFSPDITDISESYNPETPTINFLELGDSNYDLIVPTSMIDLLLNRVSTSKINEKKIYTYPSSRVSNNHHKYIEKVSRGSYKRNFHTTESSTIKNTTTNIDIVLEYTVVGEANLKRISNFKRLHYTAATEFHVDVWFLELKNPTYYNNQTIDSYSIKEPFSNSKISFHNGYSAYIYGLSSRLDVTILANLSHKIERVYFEPDEKLFILVCVLAKSSDIATCVMRDEILYVDIKKVLLMKN